jgi:nucleoside-diphosphate-sugar epimerase
MGCKDSIFLVTGATGYLGSHCVKYLLDKGCRVRGTVRSLEQTEKNLALFNLLNRKAAKANLELTEARLEDPEAWFE